MNSVIELLKILVSWPVVFLIGLVIFRREFGKLVEALTSRAGDISRIETKYGNVSFVGAEELGTREDDAQPVEESIRNLKERPTANPKDAVVDVYVGRDRISRAKGVIASNDGKVFAALHVVEQNPDSIYVSLAGSEELLQASVVEKNPERELAILALPQGTYPAVTKFAQPKLNSAVTAYSGARVSSGRVEAVEAGLNIANRQISHAFFTDLPSQPGDSGAPMFDKNGALIGILIGSDSRSTIGVSVE